MLKLIKFIICIQCFILVKGMEDADRSARKVASDAAYQAQKKYIRDMLNEDWEKHKIDYLVEASNNFQIENKDFFRYNEFSVHSKYLADPFHIRRLALFCGMGIDGRTYQKRVQNLSNKYGVQDVKDELFDLNIEAINHYIQDLHILIFSGDKGGVSGYGQDRVIAKTMLWNRIRLLYETLRERLIKDLSGEFSGKLSFICTQLSKIKKNHINYLWDNLPLDEKEEELYYKAWFLKEGKANKFVELLVNIFYPLTKNVFPPQEYFDNYFVESNTAE